MKRSHLLIIILLALILGFIVLNYNLPPKYQALEVLIINVTSIVTAISIMLGKKKIESKIAWTILVLFVPVVGFLFYFILGVEYNRFKKFDDLATVDVEMDKILKKDRENITKVVENLRHKKDIIRFINNTSNVPITINNKAEILTNGDNLYKRLIEELQKAKSFIHLEYFIIKDGYVFDKIKKILIEKALEGVEVKILYDDLGCVDLSNKIIKQLNQNNIKTACFNKISFKIFRPSINYRNHRKIVVIDNKIGFTGGINIADEYAHMDPYYGFWRDTHIVIEGSAVRDLNMIFIKDWFHTTGDLLDDKKYITRKKTNHSTAIQILADGPDNSQNFIKNTFFKMINEANNRIWITTPYLILDQEIITSLKISSLSGKDVRIIVPGIHDKGKFLIYKATEAYFSELIKAGVKIYKYDKHFIHSKVMIIDNDIASVGTVNFDYRSFELNFEDTVLLYFDECISKLVKDYEEDLSKSTQITWQDWKNRNFFQKAIESIVRIFSPLL